MCGEASLQALLTKAGDLFLVSNEDTIASPDVPLNQLGTGNWLDGKQLADAKAKAVEGPASLLALLTAMLLHSHHCNDTSIPLQPFTPLTAIHTIATNAKMSLSCVSNASLAEPGELVIDFGCNSDAQLFTYTVKPEFQAKFPAGPKPLHDFLRFLDQQGATEYQLANHKKLERKAAGANGADAASGADAANGARVHYTVELQTETKWRANKPKADDFTYWALKLDHDKVKKAAHLTTIIKLECLM